MSGIGFAIGLERLIALAEKEGHDFKEEDHADVYVIGLGDVAGNVLSVVQTLRHAGFVADGNLTPRGMKAQFKSADRCKASYIVIIGEDEVKNGTVNLKKSGEKEQVSIALDELVSALQERMNG